MLGKTREAVRMKIARLGVVVDRGEKCTRSTTTTAKMSLPDELPSIEEELKVLVAVLKGLETEGLDKSEVLRLPRIVQGVKIYEEPVTRFVDYRGLEVELLEWREKYADLAKKSKELYDFTTEKHGLTNSV